MGSIIVGSVLSREAVERTEEVAYIYEGVWERSRDIKWIDHISMSLTKVNVDLFQRSRINHPHWWWAIMSFAPDILDDPGVVFTTTNNAYAETCLRGEGRAGFDAMFAPSVLWGHYNTCEFRGDNHPRNLPTHNAAEVLYPRAIPLSRVQAIYLRDGAQRSLINSWCEIYGRDPLPVVVDPALF
ncbi:MAG: DarT ssDNA thymidine ADP-ribosyltransferase family protein [Actinomycetota bacterium]